MPCSLERGKLLLSDVALPSPGERSAGDNIATGKLRSEGDISERFLKSNVNAISSSCLLRGHAFDFSDDCTAADDVISDEEPKYICQLCR